MAKIHTNPPPGPGDSRGLGMPTETLTEPVHPTPTPEALAHQIQALSEAMTSLTLEVEHLRHRVETLEHGASIRA